MDNKQFCRIRSNAMAQASMEHREMLQEMRKLRKELREAGDIISDLVSEYGLKEFGENTLISWDKQPEDIERAMQFLIEVIGD